MLAFQSHRIGYFVEPFQRNKVEGGKTNRWSKSLGCGVRKEPVEQVKQSVKIVAGIDSIRVEIRRSLRPVHSFCSISEKTRVVHGTR